MKYILRSTILACAALVATAANAAELEPRLPNTAKLHSAGWCPDPVLGFRMYCSVYKDGAATFIKYRDRDGTTVRITWSEGIEQPNTVWVRDGYDTF